jgi:hypothetical protein
MNIYEELKPRIETFKATREHVMGTASLPPTDSAVSFGEPPFAIDDGTDYYAVIEADGNVSPLPFGFQVPGEYFAENDVDAIYNKPISTAFNGMSLVRFVPLNDDFVMPGDRAFCLEAAEGSEAFDAISNMFAAVQTMVDEKTSFNFNQRLSNAIVSLYDGYDDLESVDQTISALFLEPSVLMLFALRSYRHALGEIEEEMSAEEDGESE